MRMLSSDSGQVPSSRWRDIDGPFHYLDYGGPADGPLLVCLHGLNGSAQSWAPIAPAMSKVGRVLAVDLVGFGSTSRHGRPVTLPANQRYLNRFLRQVTSEPVILVGHSMGATIAVMQASRHPETAAGLVLINPAIPWQFQDRVSPILAGLIVALALATAVRPGPGSRERSREMRRLLGEFLRMRYAGFVPAAVSVVTKGVKKGQLGDRTADPGNRAAFRSLVWTLARRWRFAAIARNVRAPALLLHGDRDRLVPPGAVTAIAAANPAWRLRVAHSIGHFPPLEAPAWTISNILRWLSEQNLSGRPDNDH